MVIIRIDEVAAEKIIEGTELTNHRIREEVGPYHEGRSFSGRQLRLPQKIQGRLLPVTHFDSVLRLSAVE
ncbi:MAG: hypothetical protein QHH01_01525 [Spirochaetales bacterium]|nr:hypothetical protein [Spirochaetales bacterium]